MTNEELYREYRRANNPSLLNQLYEQNQGLIYTLQRKYNCDIDLLYVSFAKACKTFDSDKAKFATYFTNIAYHDVLCDRRKKRPLTESMDALTEDELPFMDVIADDNNIIEQAENKNLCDKALSILNPIDREIVKQYYIDGKSQDKIADAMNIGQVSVARKLKKCLAMMREKIKEM